MRTGRGVSIVANPVLVGAITVLVAVVAVLLSYSANQGLPFVPTRALSFQVSNGSNLLPGNDVREGGYRVGVVEDMIPVRLPDGTAGAHVKLKLDKKTGSIPIDSTINLRPRSALGLKYVELNRGKSGEVFLDGGTMPASQTRFPVDLEDFYRTYDQPTRSAIRENLRGSGNALTGRGLSLNEAISGLPRLLTHLEPVARTLADEDTQLRRFFREIGDVVRVVSPVADRYAHNFSAGADVFEAWSRHPEGVAETVRRSPPTLDTGIHSFRVQQPFLADYRDLSESLRRAAATLPRTLPRITPALQEGIPVLRRTPEMNTNLRGALRALDTLTSDPATGVALRGLTDTVAIVNPLLRFVGPYITVCNYFNYAWTHAGEHLTEPDPTGSSQRTLLNQASRPRTPTDPGLGSIGARTPGNGEPVISGAPLNLHVNVYSAAIDRQGNADCESGQRGYVQRANALGDPKFNIAVDPHLPGNQGKTFTGRNRVPAGQTFTRAPQTGPQMPKALDP